METAPGAGTETGSEVRTCRGAFAHRPHANRRCCGPYLLVHALPKQRRNRESLVVTAVMLLIAALELAWIGLLPQTTSPGSFRPCLICSSDRTRDALHPLRPVSPSRVVEEPGTIAVPRASRSATPSPVDHAVHARRPQRAQMTQQAGLVSRQCAPRPRR
jgi:hypothetical protein